jgi:ubiquinone/menaquinone biosynthesis C-methylase UbiE
MTQIRLLFSANGLRWTVYFGLLQVFKRGVKAVDERMARLEIKYALPGNTSVARNYEKWTNYDWGEAGEEWTSSPEWKQSLIDEAMLKYMNSSNDVLEVGPGAGRWTEALQKVAQNLLVVDLSDKCIELCRKRFARCSNIKFFANDGFSLPFIPDESIDYLWSFDVFVHIAPCDAEKYAAEFSRIFRKGARGVIHHANEVVSDGYWRSRMTGQRFSQILQGCGFTVIRQFSRWGDDEQYGVPGDLITVFEK